MRVEMEIRTARVLQAVAVPGLAITGVLLGAAFTNKSVLLGVISSSIATVIVILVAASAKRLSDDAKSIRTKSFHELVR
jgi:hypothetical protein